MLCPVCKVDLKMTDREGIEIDYCPQCRGVWLDRGELDKIVERSASRESSRRREDEDDDRGRREYRDDDDYKYQKKKGYRKGFLGELFDFG